jgi:hypothetical protein
VQKLPTIGQAGTGSLWQMLVNVTRLLLRAEGWFLFLKHDAVNNQRL